MNLIKLTLDRARKLFWWQLTVSEVSFIGEEGVTTVYHIHPASWSKERVYFDALERVFPVSANAGGDDDEQ